MAKRTVKFSFERDRFLKVICQSVSGSGLVSREQAKSIAYGGAKPMIVIAAAPRSGSTYLTAVTSKLTGLDPARLSAAYSTNEHDLSVPALCLYSAVGCVSQLHIKGTYHNASLMQAFGIKPIILTRNIYDTIVSLRDDLRRKAEEADFGTGLNGYSFLWCDHTTQALDDTSLTDLIIDLAVPWYVNFYVSWTRLHVANCVTPLWVTYEQLMENKRQTVDETLAFVGVGNIAEDVEAVLGKRFNFNVGEQGRGAATLTNEQMARIQRQFSYYADIDFSGYGLSKPRVD